jgi:hypothetical protein
LWKHLTGRHKSIHLTLDVKTFFENSTPTMGPVWNPTCRSPDFLMTDIIGITERKRRRTCTQKVAKQSMSDYAQED